jgi:hypothetical protein
MLSKPILLNNFKRTLSPNTDYLLMEDLITEDSKVEDRIKELAKDPETQKAIGGSPAQIEDALMMLFKRGYGAAQTNFAAVHPSIQKLGKGPASYNAWGHARLNAFIRKTKGYETTDSDIADWLKGKGEKPEQQ